MNQKKCIVVFCLLLLLLEKLLGQSTTEDSIEGIYLGGVASPIGIKVEKLPDGNYIFTDIGRKSNGEIISSEWQSAYVIENHNSTYFFYWHLGREDPDDPTTNHIIVYNVTIDRRRMTGTRFFPYSEKLRYEPVRYEKTMRFPYHEYEYHGDEPLTKKQQSGWE
ncbi:MAG: hypothetical protein LBP20_04415 [Treponema sp.]|jgi:hypothetical protein|nr:hypothetical protein [Treponema sp.]